MPDPPGLPVSPSRAKGRDGRSVSCVAEDHGRFLGVPSLGVVIQTSENAAIKHKYSLESRHGVVVTKVVELSSAAGVLEEGDGKLCRLRSVPDALSCFLASAEEEALHSDHASRQRTAGGGREPPPPRFG